jgi:hypothetical protein
MGTSHANAHCTATSMYCGGGVVCMCVCECVCVYVFVFVSVHVPMVVVDECGSANLLTPQPSRHSKFSTAQVVHNGGHEGRAENVGFKLEGQRPLKGSTSPMGNEFLKIRIRQETGSR